MSIAAMSWLGGGDSVDGVGGSNEGDTEAIKLKLSS